MQRRGMRPRNCKPRHHRPARPLAPRGRRRITAAGRKIVTAVIAISTLVCLAGLLGLAMAALAADPAARVLGMGLFVLAWLAMAGYHGRRAERRARAG